MDTKQFIELTLAEGDDYVLYISNGEYKWNENYSTVDELVTAIKKYDKTQATVYHAIGKFNNNQEVSPKTGRISTKRKQHMATRFKTLCADLDIGPDKPYKTQKEAAGVLLKACNTMGMPHPMLVSSGYGVHVYWILETSIAADLWEKMSIRLRIALQEHGVALDVSKIHDRSMVLRPVGTHNKKNPSDWKAVKVVHNPAIPSTAHIASVLAKFKTTQKPKAAQKPKARQSSVASVILNDSKPVELQDIVNQCSQVAALVMSGGVTDASGSPVEEPLWRASLGIAKYCTDVEAAVEALAGQYPGFDLEENMQKLSAWGGTGPATCSMFERHCPSGCDDCPIKGKVTSPAVIRSVTTQNDPIVVEDPESGSQYVTTLPKGYIIENGALWKTNPGSDDLSFVAPYEIYVLSRYTNVDENRGVLKASVNFPQDGMKIVDLDIPTISAGGSEFIKMLALKQIYLVGDGKLLKDFFMTYLQKLQRLSSIELFYKHFGWQHDGTYLAGCGLIGSTTSNVTHYDGPIQQYLPYMKPKGDIKAWTKATKFFSHPELRHHGFVFLVAAGAPIMKGSGLSSILVNMYSRDSGSGKTLTGRFGLSVWGNPSWLTRVVNDTDNSLYKHFGLMNSQGGYLDELTTMDTERMRNFVFALQEGRERARVTQSSDGFRDKVYWNMPIISSSNKDIHEAMGSRYSSEAEKLRVLQLPFDRVDLFVKAGSKVGYQINRFIDSNYGLAGPLIVEEIIRRGGPEVVYQKAYDRFETKYRFSFSGQERFYHAACVCADAVGEIMQDLGLIEFDYVEQVARVLKFIMHNRDTIEQASMIGLDAIMQFLTEHSDEIVQYRETKGINSTSYIVEPVPKTAVARTEVLMSDSYKVLGGKIFINRASLRSWARHNGLDYKGILADLTKENISAYDTTRKCLYKNVKFAAPVGQTYCVEIDIGNNARLLEACSVDHEPTTAGRRLDVVNNSRSKK